MISTCHLSLEHYVTDLAIVHHILQRSVQESYQIFFTHTHKKHSNKTKLSKNIWYLKENQTDFTIKWSIIKKSISHTEGSERRNLCLEEKISILKEKKQLLV